MRPAVHRQTSVLTTKSPKTDHWASRLPVATAHSQALSMLQAIDYVRMVGLILGHPIARRIAAVRASTVNIHVSILINLTDTRTVFLNR
jgi:hypothetical protein